MSYKAIVSRIQTRPIEGRDKIVAGSCHGFQIITSKDTKDGQLGVFFEAGGQVSEEFAEKNDLYVRKDPETGTRLNSGYFEPNRRVKSIRLAGMKSEGFFVPLFPVDEQGKPLVGAFDYTGFDIATLKEGDVFDELNGHKICQKYYSPATLRAMRGGTKRTRRENRMFSEHVDTEPLRRHLADIPAGALITLTEKIHGTSHRIGHVLDTIAAPEGKLRRAVRLAKNWLLKTADEAPTTDEWTILNGSRRVILEWRDQTNSYYGSDNFRKTALHGVAPHKGEIIYGEIIGFTDEGRPIMEPQAISDKELKRKFGDQFVYTYGQPEGTCRFYIYRITRTNEDGDEVDLSWFEVERRARQLGIPTVPFIEAFVFDGNHRDLLDRVDRLVNGESGDAAIPSSLDSRHIQEGVVVRSDSPKGTSFFKHKSFQFGIHEGYLKEKDSHVDMEEVS